MACYSEEDITDTNTMAGNNDDDVVGGGVAKWRVVSVLNGQEVDNVAFSRFADVKVWALRTAVEALDEDIEDDDDEEDEDAPEWCILTRAEVDEAFANGEWSARVAWFGEAMDAATTYVRIERLVVA